MSNCTWQSMAPWQEVSIVVFLKLPLCHYGVIKVLTSNRNCFCPKIGEARPSSLLARLTDWTLLRSGTSEAPTLRNRRKSFNLICQNWKHVFAHFPQTKHIYPYWRICLLSRSRVWSWELGLTWIRWQALPVDKWCSNCKSSSDLVIADLPLMQAHLWIYLCRLSMAYVKNIRSQVLIIRWKYQLERSHNNLFWENIKAATWYAWEMWYTTYYSIEQ